MNWNFLMTNVALAVREDGTYAPFSGEGWQYAAEMTLMGMGAVFGVLILLMLVVKIFGMLFASSSVKAAKEAERAEKEARKNEKAKKTEASGTAAEAAPMTVATSVADDAALIAVITAAVAAYRAAEDPDEASAGGFRVVSFRRAGGGRGWNASK